MKIIYLIPTLILFFSCSENKTKTNKKVIKLTTKEVVVPEIQSIIDSADVKGSILVFDLKDDTFYSNDFKWAMKENLPASTFKIAHSIIAFEIGVVENDSTIFKWNGEKRKLKNWEQDLMFKDAFHYSCVPCYQEVARKIGPKNMNFFINKLEYGKIKVDSTNIDLFWLQGESRISQFQQIDFLKRLYQSELPISKRTETIIKKMMIMEGNSSQKLSGKTGWSIRNGKNNGWFVGYIEYNTRTYFFATNIEPKQDFDINKFLTLRKDVTFKALDHFKMKTFNLERPTP